MGRLKAAAARGQLEKSNRTPRSRTKRTRQKKRAFDPRHVNDDRDDDEDTFAPNNDLPPAVALVDQTLDDLIDTNVDDGGKELPSGWEELFDEVEGTPYYYNESLNKTVWDRPQKKKKKKKKILHGIKKKKKKKKKKK